MRKQYCVLDNMTNDQLIELFVKLDYSLSAIDQHFQLSKSHSERLFRKRGIDYNKIREDFKRNVLLNYENNPTLCAHCGKPLPWKRRNEKFCNKSCAAKFNCNRDKDKGKESITIKKVKKSKRIKSRPLSRSKKIKPKKISLTKRIPKDQKKKIRSAKLHNLLVDTSYSKYSLPHISPGQCPICGEFDCKDEFCKTHSLKILLNLVDHIGFDVKTIGTKDVKLEFKRVQDLINKLYWEDKLSTVDIGVKFGYPEKRLPTNIVRFLGLKTRTVREFSRNTVLMGKKLSGLSLDKEVFKAGLHITWDNEEVLLRSSYEFKYAQKLDNLKIKYKVEFKRIEYFDSVLQRDRIAIPDFYLPDTNEIVEIKSDFTLDIQEMLDKFDAYKKLGYIPKLILEHEEIDLYNIENLISPERLEKIKTQNIKQVCKNEKATNISSDDSHNELSESRSFLQP
jgi:hypothetical protein